MRRRKRPLKPHQVSFRLAVPREAGQPILHHRQAWRTQEHHPRPEVGLFDCRSNHHVNSKVPLEQSQYASSIVPVQSRHFFGTSLVFLWYIFGISLVLIQRNTKEVPSIYQSDTKDISEALREHSASTPKAHWARSELYRGMIVTWDTGRQVTGDGITINVVAVWRWLLQKSTLTYFIGFLSACIDTSFPRYGSFFSKKCLCVRNIAYICSLKEVLIIK